MGVMALMKARKAATLQSKGDVQGAMALYEEALAKGLTDMRMILAYTVLLIVTITLTLTAVTVSDWLLDYAVAHFRLPAFVALLWGKLRFPVAGVAGFFALCALYALAQDGPQRWRNIWPGTVSALGAWLGLSWFYNLYVEHFAHYSVLYGSIGTIIVLLIWLNMSAVTLIMGAEMNGVLMAMGSGKEREELL